jgi:hypothetical protein
MAEKDVVAASGSDTRDVGLKKVNNHAVKCFGLIIGG